jgi:hypothetical protein
MPNPRIACFCFLAVFFLSIVAIQAQWKKAITLPSIIPTPISIQLKKGAILLGKSVVLVATPGTGSETVDLIKKILTSTGVETIGTAKKLPTAIDRTYILLGKDIRLQQKQ